MHRNFDTEKKVLWTKSKMTLQLKNNSCGNYKSKLDIK